jgi:octaprenyl-diphosphate synthase
LSCDLAAFLSGAPAEQRAALREFGAAFGTAYQVYDDCVDLFGSEARRANRSARIWRRAN